ncbi:MAG: lysophospholipid acyltransferase family protein [Pseudomonadota bacterium]
MQTSIKLRHRLGSWLFLPALVLWSAPFAALVPVLMIVPKEWAWVRRLSRRWAHGTLSLLRILCGVRHRVEGDWPSGPAIIAASHHSMWETAAFVAIDPDACLVTKQSLGRFPVFGWYLRHFPMIMIDRNGRASTLKEMVRATQTQLAAGRRVIIFPSGTRVAFASEPPLQRGIAMLARACAVPVVPVAHNAGQKLGRGFDLREPGEIVLCVLPPLSPDLSGGELVTALSRALEDGETALA